MEICAKDYNITELFENISYKVLNNRKKNRRSRGKTISLHNKSDIINFFFNFIFSKKKKRK